ncbi:hypothetical protein D3C71_424770 [compost metagenome]
MRIDRDGALVVELHARRLEAEALRVGHAAGGEEHGVGLDLLAARERDHEAVGAARDGRGLAVQAHVDAGLAHLVGKKLAHVVVEAGEQVGAAVQLRHLGAQAVEDRCELAGDVAAAHHQQALGERVEVEHRVGGHDVFAAWNLGHEGRAAGGHQQVARGVALAFDFHRVRIDQLGPAGDERDA